MTDKPAALVAADASPRIKPSNYPEPFASRMGERLKRPLGDLFGLKNFGVNLTRLSPGTVSALHHTHSRQDEFIYVVEGEPTLFTDAGETRLRPGMVAGFAAGGTAHHLEIGRRPIVSSSRWATAPRETRSGIRPTTFRRSWAATESGSLHIRTATHTELGPSEATTTEPGRLQILARNSGGMEIAAHVCSWPFSSFAPYPRFGSLRGGADIDAHRC